MELMSYDPKSLFSKSQAGAALLSQIGEGEPPQERKPEVAAAPSRAESSPSASLPLPREFAQSEINPSPQPVAAPAAAAPAAAEPAPAAAEPAQASRAPARAAAAPSAPKRTQVASAGNSSSLMTFDPRQIFSRSVNGVKMIVSAAASRYDLPPDLLHNIAGTESSYNPSAKNKTGSSAKGLFQFIDSTWKAMGGKPGEQTDPIANAELGAKYIKQNADLLRRNLKRDPTYGEVYSAHYFGPGVARMLASAKPNMSIEQGLATFQSPERVQLVMKQNPNLRGKTVGEVMEFMNRKAGRGVVSSRAPSKGQSQLAAAPSQDATQVASADAAAYEDAWMNDNYETLA